MVKIHKSRPRHQLCHMTLTQSLNYVIYCNYYEEHRCTTLSLGNPCIISREIGGREQCKCNLISASTYKNDCTTIYYIQNYKQSIGASIIRILQIIYGGEVLWFRRSISDREAF